MSTKQFSITRQQIDRGADTRHRVVVRFFANGKWLIDTVVESRDEKYAYRFARKRAGVKGRVPVERLEPMTEDEISMHH